MYLFIYIAFFSLPELSLICCWHFSTRLLFIKSLSLQISRHFWKYRLCSSWRSETQINQTRSRVEIFFWLFFLYKGIKEKRQIKWNIMWSSGCFSVFGFFLTEKFDWLVFTKLADQAAKLSKLTLKSTNQTESCSGSTSSSTTHPAGRRADKEKTVSWALH